MAMVSSGSLGRVDHAPRRAARPGRAAGAGGRARSGWRCPGGRRCRRPPDGRCRTACRSAPCRAHRVRVSWSPPRRRRPSGGRSLSPVYHTGPEERRRRVVSGREGTAGEADRRAAVPRRARAGDEMRLEGARCLVVGGARRAGPRHRARPGRARRRRGGEQPVGDRRGRRRPAPPSVASGGAARPCSGDAAAPRRGHAPWSSAAAEALGGLDVLVYTASGPFGPALPQHIDPRDWQASFDVSCAASL